MNTQTDLEIETLTPLEEIKQVDRPPATERIPILIEINEQDRQKATPYANPHGCIVMQALMRNGFHPSVTIGKGRMRVNGYEYHSDEISYRGLFAEWEDGGAPFYTPEVVGKQIILYPV